MVRTEELPRGRQRPRHERLGAGELPLLSQHGPQRLGGGERVGVPGAVDSPVRVDGRLQQDLGLRVLPLRAVQPAEFQREPQGFRMLRPAEAPIELQRVREMTRGLRGEPETFVGLADRRLDRRPDLGARSERVPYPCGGAVENGPHPDVRVGRVGTPGLPLGAGLREQVELKELVDARRHRGFAVGALLLLEGPVAFGRRLHLGLDGPVAFGRGLHLRLDGTVAVAHGGLFGDRRAVALFTGARLRLPRRLLGTSGADRLPGAGGDAEDEHDENGGDAADEGLVPARKLADLVQGRGGQGEDGLVIQVPPDVGSQIGGRGVSPRLVLLEGLRDDRFDITPVDAVDGAERGGFLLANGLDRLVQQLAADIVGQPAAQQLVEDDAQRIDILRRSSARVGNHPACRATGRVGPVPHRIP